MKLSRLFDHLPAFIIYLLCGLGVVLGLWALVVGLRLIPPNELSIAAGSPGSAYYQIAQQYQQILARDKITLNIIESAGSVENRDLIEENESVDIALIQGGIASTSDKLNALAAVFPEPLLAFARKDAALSGNPHDWADRKIALGAIGSGTRAIVMQLAMLTEASALSQTTDESLLGGQSAASALLEGEIDLAFFVAPLDAPYLTNLINHPDIELLSIDHSQALASKMKEARYVELYSGAVVYEPSYPESNVPLITLVTKLVAKDDLHPALVNRLIHAVQEVHGQRIQLVMSAPFPNTELLDMPADVYASKLLRDGFNPLENVLPFWVVAQINRFAILLLPIIFILLPLFKLLPALLAWRIQSRVYRHYERLHEIDTELSEINTKQFDQDKLEKLDTELFDIESDLRCESLPLKYRENAYNAMHHIQLVRIRLLEMMKQ